MDMPEEFRELLERFDTLSFIQASSLPEIDLYMDQLTTFMEDRLKDQRRYPEDKILTKTMINNYTKNRLLPPPVKKKYSQDHLVTLLYTYYLKSIISIGDITTLLAPMSERYWDRHREDPAEAGHSMKDIYARILTLAPGMSEDFRADLEHKMEAALTLFSQEDLTEEERDYLQKFTLCTQLACDVYLKKKIIERIIDDMKKEEE